MRSVSAGWVPFPAFTLPITSFAREMLVGRVEPTEGPQAQAIAQDAANVIAPHFHDVAQFQVIVGGTGIIGRHPVTKGTFRFVDAHRVYGPVRPDDSGLVYLTLRAAHDPCGPHYMPESRELLADRRPIDPRGLGFDVTALDTCWRDVRYSDPDGLDVSACNFSRYEPMHLQMGGAGGYVVLIGGELEGTEGIGRTARRSAVSCCWLHAEQRLEDRAGGNGARVLRLQFPR